MTVDDAIRWIKRFYWDKRDLLNKVVDVNLKTGAKVNDGTIWHSGNDGTGSGLDADLLDGSEATAFAKLASSSVAFTGVSTFTINSFDVLPVAWSTPSLNTGWATLAGWHTVQYMRNGRLLTLTGVAQATSATPSAVIFTLPSGYRPSAGVMYAGHSFLSTGSPQYMGRGVQVTSAGNVAPTNWTPALNDWVALDITIGL